MRAVLLSRKWARGLRGTRNLIGTSTVGTARIEIGGIVCMLRRSDNALYEEATATATWTWTESATEMDIGVSLWQASRVQQRLEPPPLR